MFYLRFIDRKGDVPHRTFNIMCDSYHSEQVVIQKGETLEKYSPSIAQTFFPFEDDSRWEPTEQNEQVLLITVNGAKEYRYIAGRDMILERKGKENG
jgi:hypothetical protein